LTLGFFKGCRSGSSKVVAGGSSTLSWGSSKVELKSKTAVVLSKGNIFVLKTAKVIRKTTISAEELLGMSKVLSGLALFVAKK